MSAWLLGLDLSLTCTGVALWHEGGNYTTGTIAPKTRGHDRLAHILHEVADACVGNPPTLVLIEGGAPGSARFHRTGHDDLAGLRWVVRHQLWQQSIPYVMIAPNKVKKYATGNGAASKSEVLAATIRRYPGFTGTTDDEADALTVAAIGAHHHGWPTPTLPKTHTDALKNIDWPERP